MNRTLAISVLLAVSAGAVGQNPAVVQKTAQAVKGGAQTQSSVSAKPSPVTVKAVPAAVVAVKPASAQSKPSVAAVQPVPSKAATASAAKPTSAQAVNKGNAKATVAVPAAKPAAVTAKPVVAVKPAQKAETPVKATAVPLKTVPVKAGEPKVAATKAQSLKKTKVEPAAKAEVKKVAVKDMKVAGQVKDQTKKPAAKSVSQSGRRDPFVSPIVSVSAVNAGCSSGKRCLAIDQIALKGIVKSDNGMIAVVVNAAAKAYFLRENDPVFNGYVMKITGDSVVFKETFHDKLGKPLTRDVTKSISRPVA